MWIIVLTALISGVEASTHQQGVISPVVIPEFSSLEINREGSNRLISSFALNSANPDMKICKMVDIRDSAEIISYVVL